MVNSVLGALLSRILRTPTLSSTRHDYTLTVNQDSAAYELGGGNHQSSHFQRQQQPPALQIPPHFTTGWQMLSKPHNGKDSHVELPQELIYFLES